uniref:DRBM domain-containing protein n=1 Tax=Kalanchoe fedtschenkoi TaxID=63787 RepID=A0A7N0U4M7_KALFE
MLVATMQHASRSVSLLNSYSVASVHDSPSPPFFPAASLPRRTFLAAHLYFVPLSTFSSPSITMEDKDDQVCPTEDAVAAFMDFFLQPLLPVKSAKAHAPTAAQQEAVANQAHAVVVLYNYYHRKQHPHLEFLDFVSFCELMVILKPNMLAYMKFMQLSNDKETEDLDMEKHMSLTEKRVMDACCICKQSDTVKGTPIIKGLAVCKVAVLLVDAGRENCFLRFSYITKGAWSLIEKEVDAVTFSNHGCKSHVQPKGFYMRKRATQKPMNSEDSRFQKIALSAIVEATVIKQANLEVLESHHVHSLNKERAVVRFFIVKCTKPFSENITPVPIRYVIDSLQGPLVKRDCISWSVTEAVAYFHMFPYAAIMSEWLSRDLIAASRVSSVDKSHIAREPSDAPAVEGSDGLTSASGSAILVDTKINTNNVFQKGGTVEKVIPDIPMAEQQQFGDTFCALSQKNGYSSQSNIKVKDELAETKFHSNSSEDKATEPKCVLHAIASSRNMLSQSALKVVLRKREKLTQQRRDIEDEIALCDQTIQSILSGREDDLAIKLESLMEACSDMNLTSPIQSRDGILPKYDDETSVVPMPLKRKRTNDTTPLLQNPCKQLDEMCHENNWTMPNYCVSQTRGGFQGRITVTGEGFELSESGDWFSNLFEARESAAKHILDKLCCVNTKAR